MDPIEQVPLMPTLIGKGPHEEFLSALILAITNAFVRSSQRVNGVYPKDGTEPMDAPVKLKEFTVATRPTASAWEGGIIYVSDGGAGAVFQGSNGTAWVNLG